MTEAGRWLLDWFKQRGPVPGSNYGPVAVKSFTCAGVVVNSGDIVVSDDDGVVVVPQNIVKRILPLCERRAAIEQVWFERVSRGESTLDVVGLRARLEEFGIEYE